MNFLTTSYVYPLPEKISLSHHLNFSLDNPRTEDEISTVKDYLFEAYNAERGGRFLLNSYRPDEALESILFDFRDAFNSDEYVAKFFNSYERERIFEFIARMWVIARFNDEGNSQLIKEALMQIQKAQPDKYYVLLEDTDPIIKNSEKVGQLQLFTISSYSFRG